MTTRRCRWFGHRWGSWLWDDWFGLWHRPCMRRGCVMGQAKMSDSVPPR